jgi:hypothetical protein
MNEKLNILEVLSSGKELRRIYGLQRDKTHCLYTVCGPNMASYPAHMEGSFCDGKVARRRR